jgi:hypothetical protein
MKNQYFTLDSYNKILSYCLKHFTYLGTGDNNELAFATKSQPKQFILIIIFTSHIECISTNYFTHHILS